ncbi:MAG: AzlC family ABC transporter permease [Chloroflexi bacterium]|nr:MAG: AzlC family ABC transporter permease [Chloroflexota bacterium]
MPPDKASTTSAPPGTSSDRTATRSADPRKGIVRDALGIAIASGAYAISFGAISSAAGLSVLQTCALSVLMFTGASQFALVGVIGGGGSVWAGAAAAALLGSRNALYGLRLSSLLGVRGRRRVIAAHFVIDETTAMAIARDDPNLSRFAFWATGAALFILWNLGTLGGAVAAHAFSNPKVLGLDAAPPAAFLALLAPRLRAREPLAIALAAAVVAIAVLPFVPAGVPLLIIAVLVSLYGVLRTTR